MRPGIYSPLLLNKMAVKVMNAGWIKDHCRVFAEHQIFDPSQEQQLANSSVSCEVNCHPIDNRLTISVQVVNTPPMLYLHKILHDTSTDGDSDVNQRRVCGSMLWFIEQMGLDIGIRYVMIPQSSQYILLPLI